MLSFALHSLKLSARQIKSSGKVRKPPGAQKVQLTEEEITSLYGTGVKPKTTVQDLFKAKYADKINPNQTTQAQNPTQAFQPKMKLRQQKAMHDNKPLPKHIPKSERLAPEDATLQDLTSVRLQPQYLPISYLRQAQKVFHKYGQARLRQIASSFSEYVRLNYQQQKIDYQLYPELKFNRLQAKLPPEKQVPQIHLIGEAKIYDEDYRQKMQLKSTLRKEDKDPIEPSLKYTHNIAISYLLNRAPRTFATAVRLLTELKYKYPKFKPDSFIDFGSGLSSGACAFIDVFDQTENIYCVEPSSKMRKLSGYLTEGMKIHHFQTIGEMAAQVSKVDIVYAGYVLNQLRPQYVEIYLEALYAKVKPSGFLILTDHGSPFAARLMHQARKWAIQKQMFVAAPCPHQLKCPLARSKSWCHFDQPSGMYPSNIFGKLPTDQAVKLEKFTYLILQKQSSADQLSKIEPNETANWDRVIFPVIRRGRHTIVTLCTRHGRFEKRISAKSHGPEYRQIKKLRWGDYWRFGKRIPNKFRKQRVSGKRLW